MISLGRASAGYDSASSSSIDGIELASRVLAGLVQTREKTSYLCVPHNQNHGHGQERARSASGSIEACGSQSLLRRIPTSTDEERTRRDSRLRSWQIAVCLGGGWRDTKALQIGAQSIGSRL